MDPQCEAALATLARARAGVFSRPHARAWGVPGAVLDRRVATGQLIERHPRIYQAASSEWDLTAKEHAALLAAGPEAMLSHDNAACWWDLGTPLPETVWITLPFEATRVVLEGVDVVRSRHTAPFRRTKEGRPLTSPSRTWVDLGRTRTLEQLDASLAVGLQRRLMTLESIDAVMAVAHNRAGTSLIRRVLPHFQPEWESVLSAEFGRLTLAAGIVLTPGHYVYDDTGALLALLDFADPEARVAIEVDGWHFHGSKLQQQRDKARDRRLSALGWVTLRFTTEDIRFRPEAVLAEVRAVLAARRAA